MSLGGAKAGEDAQRERAQRRTCLMVAMQDGDADACRALLDDIGPSILAFIRRRIADRHEVEDVYQETFLAMFRARHTYDPSRPLEPWLFAIARNVAADHARRFWARANWQELVETPPEVAAEADVAPGPILEDALGKLPESQREAFTMLKLEGLTLEEAAERAGVSIGALKVRAHRAYKALRKIIGG
jgi:RNA polymerase sigma-70 factor (ECF subfamily)